MSTDKEQSVFETLKYSGEHFFENKAELDEVRKKSKDLHKFKTKFNDNNSSADSKKKIGEFFFKSLKITEPAKIEYEKRRECYPEEEQLIQKRCLEHNISDNDIEEIKHALGFMSKKQNLSQFKKPCVAVVGQTKAGKSSLINALLRDKVVPQKLTKQTARVTYVTYCSTRFVAYMKPVKKENRLIHLRVDVDVDEEDVDLKFEDRRKVDEVNVEVRVGVKNLILRNGFDIVDSPGLNENPALNELCQKMEKSLVPLLIYVIDGRNGLTETDIGDIKSIRDGTPEIKILYFVTKLDRTIIDRAMYERTKKRKETPPDKDLPGENDLEVADRRLVKVFWKLKNNAFVAPSLEHFRHCPEFNGANLAAIQKFRILDYPMTTEIDVKTVELFEKFERNLCHDLKNMIEEPLNKDIASLQTALENVLENACLLASDVAIEKQDRIMCLDKFKDDETEMYNKQLKYIEEKLSTEISGMLERYETSVCQLLQDHKFQSKNPPSACRKRGGGRDNPGLFDEADDEEEMMLPFRHEVREFIENTLKTQMEDFIAKFLWQCDDNLTNELQEIVKTLTTGKFGRPSFQVMLKNRLYYSYELAEACCVTHNKEYFSQHPIKRQRNNQIVSWVRDLIPSLRNRDQQRHDAETKDASVVAKKLLSDLDKKEFIEKICDKVTSGFKENHEQFIKAMNDEKNVLQPKWEFDDNERDRLKIFSEDMAVLYTRILMVSTRIHLPIDENRGGSSIGRGNQAEIKTVYLMGQKEPIVRKSFHRLYKGWKQSQGGKALALEVYYTSRLTNHRFLVLKGIMTDTLPTGKFRFSSFHHYYPHGSLRSYLEKNEISLQTRLKLAIDISNGLKSLHEYKIIHRDISLENILVSSSKEGGSDDVVQAIIGDFGILSTIGFADTDLHITSSNTPVELFDDMQRKQLGYTFASDVYSFGISLWQLLSYKLLRDPEYNNYEPQFIIDCEGEIEMIKKRKMELYQPEEREAIPPELNDLLKRCWLEKGRRPKMNEIKKELKKYFEKIKSP